MSKTIITIILCLGVVLLLLGGALLYVNLSSDSYFSAPAPVQQGEATSGEAVDSSDDPYEIIVVPNEDQPTEEPYPGPAGEDDPTLEPAPDFSLTDRSGAEHKLSDYYGKPIIINFWATWCGPCTNELPHFNEAFLQYQDRIQFMMVDLVDGSYETENSAIQFVDENNYSFPLFFDSKGEGSAAYEISAIPFTVAINSYGRIVATHLGSMSRAELDELISQLLR